MPGLALADLAQRIQTTGNQKLTILWTEIYRINRKIIEPIDLVIENLKTKLLSTFLLNGSFDWISFFSYLFIDITLPSISHYLLSSYQSRQ